MFPTTPSRSRINHDNKGSNSTSKKTQKQLQYPQTPPPAYSSSSLSSSPSPNQQVPLPSSFHTPSRRPLSSSYHQRSLIPRTPASICRAPASRRKTPLTATATNSSNNKLPRQRPLDQPVTVFFLRHGESLGQAASSPTTRRTDASLQDCSLSLRGMEQAKNIPALLGDDYPKIQRVLCSPLKRALETAVLAFAKTSSSSVSIPIDIHYDLREIGDASIPENQPLAETVSSFVEQYECIRVLPATATSSEALLLHSQWPRRHDASPKVLRRNQVRRLVSDYIIRQQQMLLEKEEEKLTCIAVVCHYHVIRAALSDPYDIRGSMVQPKNAMPIRCVLDEYGILEPVLL